MAQTTAAKPVKIAGPDHPIAIEANPNRVQIWAAGRVVADTRKALTLHEAGYPAVQYIPREDVDMTLLERPDPGKVDAIEERPENSASRIRGGKCHAARS